jgi:hypothetical protein
VGFVNIHTVRKGGNRDNNNNNNNILAFTPAKNATKPKFFKIIPLQTTRKENNWETEETMEREAVTLEKEPAKWPNPGSL